MARRRDRAVLDAPLPRGPGLLGAVVPGRLHHRELPGPVPQLVLLDARDVHGAPARGAVQDDLRLRPRLRRGRPADAQELGQRDRVRRGGRADGRRRHALDVRQGPARGQHPVRLARRRRGAARAARPLERLRVLRDLRPAGRLDRRREAAPPARGRGRPSTAGSCRGPPGPRPPSRTACATSTRSARRARCPPSSTASRPGTCACRDGGSRDRTTPPTGTPRSRRCTRRSSATRRMLAPILPFLAEAMYGNLVDDGRSRRARQRPPDALADGRPGRASRRALEAAMAIAQARRRPGPDAAQRGPAQDPPAAGARPGSPCPDRGLDVGPRAAPAHRRRDQRQGGRASSPTSRRSSSGGSSRCCRRSASASASAIPAVMAAARERRRRRSRRTAR